jgi:SHS2 domain-containing protein
MHTRSTNHPDAQRGAAGSGWSHFHHVADVGVRGIGRSLPEAFAQAAVALTAVITDPGNVRAQRTVEVACAASDPEVLLVDWLNAVIFEMATRRMLFSSFEVRIDGRELSATLAGEPIENLRHEPAAEVKGASMSELRVQQLADGRWVAQCVVDV